MTIFDKIIKKITDPDMDFDERIFLLLTSMAEAALIIMIIADVMVKENVMELLILGINALINPVVVYFCIKYHKVDAGSKFISVFLVLILMPVIFFYGGGPDGGAIIWFTFCYTYVGILLKGKTRTAALVVLSFTIIFDYAVAYYYPDIIFFHNRKTYYIDSMASVLMVGILIFFMVMFQNMVYIMENKKAREESKKVEQLNLTRNNFFINMSHEIRTPINTILGLNEMILREDISDEVAEDSENIQAAGNLLLHLINDILDMSKLESGKMTLTPSVYSPGDMLSEIVALLWIRAKEKGLDFHVDISPDIPASLEGDEVRIKQILINVINNSIKYTKEGSVTLSIEKGETNGNMTNIIYSVTDTGIGIKKENIPYLFTAFKRVDEERNKYIEGTGLGLSIVKQLIDLMGGRITVNSVYTRGSTFIIEIPQRVMDDKQIGEIDLENRQDRGHREGYRAKFEAPDAKILLVDDNATNLMVAEKLLRDTKVQIDKVLSGKEALIKTLSQEYQVIFMDHLMPEMDGIVCTKRIRNQAGGLSRESKIVALTANAGGDNRQLYEREGFDGYLTKPVSGEAIEKELYRLLPKSMVTVLQEEGDILENAIQWLRSDKRKRAVSITTDSVADIPDALMDKYDISIIHHRIDTRDGSFRDGVEIETRGLLNYLENPENAASVKTRAPDVSEYEEFFGRELTNANNIIHISLTGRVKNSGQSAAAEAATSFDNVFVVDSGFLSGGEGYLVIEACRLAENGFGPDEILKQLERTKRRIHTSFIVDNLDNLSKASQVSNSLSIFTRSLMVRPVLRVRSGKISLGGILFGSRETAWDRYIRDELRNMGEADKKELFVYHAGIPKRELDLIRNKIERRIDFDRIYFHQVSPVIAANSGSGTLGLLYVKE